MGNKGGVIVKTMCGREGGGVSVWGKRRESKLKNLDPTIVCVGVICAPFDHRLVMFMVIYLMAS